MTNPLPTPAPTSRAVTLPLEVAYTSLDEAFDGLTTIERMYRQQRDRHGGGRDHLVDGGVDNDFETGGSGLGEALL